MLTTEKVPEKRRMKNENSGDDYLNIDKSKQNSMMRDEEYSERKPKIRK